MSGSFHRIHGKPTVGIGYKHANYGARKLELNLPIRRRKFGHCTWALSMQCARTLYFRESIPEQSQPGNTKRHEKNLPHVQRKFIIRQANECAAIPSFNRFLIFIDGWAAIKNWAWCHKTKGRVPSSAAIRSRLHEKELEIQGPATLQGQIRQILFLREIGTNLTNDTGLPSTLSWNSPIQNETGTVNQEWKGSTSLCQEVWPVRKTYHRQSGGSQLQAYWLRAELANKTALIWTKPGYGRRA